MKTVCLKIADNVLKNIDDNLERYNFSTRTEFVREAIRDKLQTLENQHFETELRKYFNEKRSPAATGISPENPDVFKELERRFGK